MTDTIPFVTGAGIERDGVTFKLDMNAMGRIQMKVPTSEPAFLEFSQVLQFCGSPAGMPILLSETSGINVKAIGDRFTASEQMAITGELINLFLGLEPSEESEPEDGEHRADPTHAAQAATGS